MRLPPIVASLGVISLFTFSAPASAQSLDLTFRADIEHLFVLTDPTRIVATALPTFERELIASVRKSRPDIGDRELAIIRETITTEFNRALSPTGEIRNALVAIYARHFTHADIRNLITFYSSETGRRAMAFVPVAAQEFPRAYNEWVSANAQRMSAATRERFKAEGLPWFLPD